MGLRAGPVGEVVHGARMRLEGCEKMKNAMQGVRGVCVCVCVCDGSVRESRLPQGLNVTPHWPPPAAIKNHAAVHALSPLCPARFRPELHLLLAHTHTHRHHTLHRTTQQLTAHVELPFLCVKKQPQFSSKKEREFLPQCPPVTPLLSIPRSTATQSPPESISSTFDDC